MTDENDPRKIIPIEEYRRPGGTPPPAPSNLDPEDDDEVELPEEHDADLFDDGLDDDVTAFGQAERPQPGLWERVGDVHPGFTYALVLLILVTFALELITATVRGGDLWTGATVRTPFIAAGACAWLAFQAGEWWRLLASVLLHANALHVGSNLLALAVLGGVAERAYGHARFLLLFVLSGAAGALTSLAHQSSLVAQGVAGAGTAGSIGASGAVFGIGAAVVVAAFRMHGFLPAWRVRALIGATLPLLLSSFAAGFARPGTDNAAHAGGALAGLVIGLALPFTARLTGGPPESPAARAAWGAAGLFALGALVASGVVAFELSSRL
jgi:membrane associated rhomboid family serine protease